VNVPQRLMEDAKYLKARWDEAFCFPIGETLASTLRHPVGRAFRFQALGHS